MVSHGGNDALLPAFQLLLPGRGAVTKLPDVVGEGTAARPLRDCEHQGFV